MKNEVEPCSMCGLKYTHQLGCTESPHYVVYRSPESRALELVLIDSADVIRRDLFEHHALLKGMSPHNTLLKQDIAKKCEYLERLLNDISVQIEILHKETK